MSNTFIVIKALSACHIRDEWSERGVCELHALDGYATNSGCRSGLELKPEMS